MKNQRILDIYLRLLDNKEVNIKKLSQKYQVSERSIHRDISDLRNFILSTDNINEIIFDSDTNNYVFKNKNSQKLSNNEALAVCKILLDSRAFLKEEMIKIIDKLLKQCILKNDYSKVSKLIENEKYYYLELQNKNSFIDILWEIGESIQNQLKVEIEYTKLKNENVKRIICPVGIMFSEYYFYLLGHIERIDKEKQFQNKDDKFPTIYRIDRILNFKILNEHFSVKFEEGEFRKRVQFMTGGKLRKLKFIYYGNSLEAVLDKVPTAVVVKEIKNGYIISAEVFGDGINRWILSQGNDIEII